MEPVSQEHDNGRDELPAEAIAALWQGNRIEAIKILRQARHIDLKEAKDKVEVRVQSTGPATQARLRSSENTAGLVRWLVILTVTRAHWLLSFYFQVVLGRKLENLTASDTPRPPVRVSLL
jgi:hypothetical protein